MGCEEVKEVIQLYLDNELDCQGTLRVQHHLETCPSCARILEGLMNQDDLLKRSARLEAVDGSRVRERTLKALRTQASQASSQWNLFPWWKRVAAVFAVTSAAVLILITGGLFSGINENVYAGVTSDHATHCSLDAGGGPVTNPDSLNKLALLFGKMKFVPDLSAFGYGQPRGRICTVDHVEFLHLVFYHPSEEPVSIFMRPDLPHLIPKELTLVPQGKFHVASVTRSGIDFLIVSSLAEDKTSAIARAVAAQI